MKNLFTFLCFVLIIISSNLLSAQKAPKTNPIYDYSELRLNNTDTIPDFASKSEKLMITGIIYEHDGKTPAKDVMLYICQPDEDGDYVMKKDKNRKRYVHHRGWIKTDADGRYTFYTFMPGKNRYVKELKQIQRVIKLPGQPEQEMNAFFFDNDPLIADLTLACRSQVVESMLRLEKQGELLVATRDIRLGNNTPELQ
jgi:protocatechuate 3,4-dioxygenase beta subunit